MTVGRVRWVLASIAAAALLAGSFALGEGLASGVPAWKSAVRAVFVLVECAVLVYSTAAASTVSRTRRPG